MEIAKAIIKTKSDLERAVGLNLAKTVMGCRGAMM